MGLFNIAKKGIAWLTAFAAACMLIACATVIAASSPAYADDGQRLYRIYNPNSGEHFYTADKNERADLCGGKRHGWSYEGVGWVSPTSGNPVYRVYNPNAGDHHYTMDEAEKNNLVALGWRDEGVGWYSDSNEAVPLYRDYNPNQFAWNHNYTANEDEHNYLISLGWNDEQVGWYGTSAPAAIVYDNATFRATYVETMTGKAPDPVALSELVSGMAGPMAPEDMVDLLVPKSDVAPRTNVACELSYGAPKLGGEDQKLPKGISENCATFFIWTSTASGYLSIELDAEGKVYPDAMANSWKYGN